MLLTEVFNLDGNFKKYFEVVPATTDALREKVYRIRYEVYCRELKYEKESERDSELETDDFDAHALHCLLRHVGNDEFVGCIRLVLVPAGQEDFRLPIERVCAALDPPFASLRADARHVAEVSRLAVLAKYRRRKGEAGQPVAISDEDYGGKDQPRFPYIPVGLYLGMIRLAQRADIRTLFVLTQERLARHLGRLGVHTHPIGEAVDHRGLRIPSTLDVEAVVRGFNRFVRPLYQVISADVDRAFPSSGAPLP